MKRYKRRIPLVSPSKIAIAALFTAIAMMMSILYAGSDNQWSIILGAVASLLLVADLLVLIGAGGEYSYSDKSIVIYFLSFPLKKLNYESYCSIVVSNAAYNNGYGYGVYGNIPMQYGVRQNHGHTKVTFPFITLHNAQCPVHKIKAGMSSRDLFMLNSDALYCLGICWFDSFGELLERTDCPVYILEDVYLRFKEQFDEAFAVHSDTPGRMHIIGEDSTSYRGR